MKESTLQKKIIDALRKKGAWVFNVHGSPFQKKGTPDLLICCQGKFYAFEIKLPGRENTLTKLQEKRLREIREAGGISFVITSVEDALKIIEKF